MEGRTVKILSFVFYAVGQPKEKCRIL